MTWKTTLLGVVESAMGGGMTALSTNMVDPQDFNVYTGKFWACAGASAALSAVKYVYRVLKRLTKDDPDIENSEPKTTP